MVRKLFIVALLTLNYPAFSQEEEYHSILDLDTVMLSEHMVYAWPGRLENRLAEVSEMAKEEIRTGH